MKKILFALLAAACAFSAGAQEKGYLTGSLESNDYVYQDDVKSGALAGDDKFGSNNYLKLDYYQGKFSAGMQIEGYLPRAVGYPGELSGVNLSNIYATWTDDSFSVTAGTFYDQFGSGLLFRSWEERALGLNNAIVGARVTYNYEDIVSFKALWGLPRFGMGVFTNNTQRENTITNTETQVRGADLSFAISNLADWSNVFLSVEGSVLSRYESISTDLVDEGGKPTTFGYSARANFESNGFFAKAEYVSAGKKYFQNTDYTSDKLFLQKNGNAQLIEFGYNGKGLGVTVTGRRLEWMNSQIISGNVSTSNLMNYVPAMCTQYTYMLTTFHPYSPQTGLVLPSFINSGEVGGQIDAFYNFRRGTALGGKRGMRVHANFSTYYALANDNLLFRDFSFDVEKQWTKKFKSILLYSLQQYNDSYGAEADYMTQNIVVADILYKWTPTFSTKLELQYLQTKQDKKDWMAALLEVNFAPHWSIYASDMFNHGSTKVHYYNAGVSYNKSRTRVALAYGRYKSGFICSGGVCRTIPAYTGASVTITTSF